MLNLKKNKSKLIICLITASIIFVWWWNRPTLTELKNCRNCEGFVEEESGDMSDIEPISDSPFTRPAPPSPPPTDENPGKPNKPGSMDRDWDAYIQKAPKTVEQWDKDEVEGDGTRHMSRKYIKQFDKIEAAGREDIAKEEKSGSRSTLCSRPASLAGMNSFNVCPAIDNSSTCGNWDSDFDYWCRKELGQDQDGDYSAENPSHKIWGRKYKYEGGCNNNPFNPWTAMVGGNGRAVCEKGWSGGKVIRPYSTSCQLWTDIGFTEFSQRMCTDTYETATGKNGKKLSLGFKPENPPDWKNPSHELWGKASRFNGGCMEGQGRVQCAKGWSDGVKLVPFSTACEEPNTTGGGIGEIYGHQLNTDCARYNKIKCPDAGLTADKCWGVKKMYTGKGGCPESLLDMRDALVGLGVGVGVAAAAGGPVAPITAALAAIAAGITAGALANRKLRRAACGIGHYSGNKLPENSTPCKSWLYIDDIDCRYYAGGKIKTETTKDGNVIKKRVAQPCSYSTDNFSQDVWGLKSKVGYGDGVCNLGSGRAVCAKGYSNGSKVLPYSSNCYGWTGNPDVWCKDTYGSGWTADKDASKKYPGHNITSGGAYNGGCDRTAAGLGNKTCNNKNLCTWGCGRAVCKKDTTPIGGTKIAWFGTNGKTMGDRLSGTDECGSRVGFNPKYICQDAFGKDYKFVEEKGCAWLSAGTKAVCKRVGGDPTPLVHKVHHSMRKKSKPVSTETPK
jgi:hypothetical protein